jgi:two-component system NtrC family sensor kinase
VRSVVGFGGTLSTGDFYTVMLFCRVPVTPEVAEQFRVLSLHVKSALFGFGEHDAFDPVPATDAAAEAAS